ncbi:MAG: CHASE3 domain-containing protein, partial [Alphaproteobacteria bacterium]|nr:CHASE3 domain-containing protein [Alphaproteobacteria bacterium]
MLKKIFSSQGLKRRIFIGVSAPLILLVILGVISLTSIDDVVETNRSLETSQEILADTVYLIAATADMESGMRGYLLAGKEEFLVPYVQGLKNVTDKIEELKEKVADDPEQIARLEDVEKILKS